MKLKPLIFSVLALPGISFGAAGIFDSLLWTTTSSPFSFGSSTFYNIDPTSGLFGSTDFDGASLGNFNPTDSLYLWGEQKSFKDNGSDVTAHTLHYQILDSGSSIVGSGAFNMAFAADLGGGDQRWASAFDGSTDSGDVLSGLGQGSYTLEVWSSINTNGTDADPQIFNNNGTNNYVASFSIVPEPSVSAVACLSLAGLLLRRRR